MLREADPVLYPTYALAGVSEITLPDAKSLLAE